MFFRYIRSLVSTFILLLSEGTKDMLMDYSGLNAVITGGASGIGKALATRILDSGGRVLIGDLNEEAGRQFIKEANESDLPLLFERADVSDWDSVEALFERGDKEFASTGGMDLVFVNAGAVKPGFPDIAGEPDLKVIDVNVKGSLYTIQAAINSFRKKQFPPPVINDTPIESFRSKFRGKILVTVSVTGLWATPCHVVYSASKHACWGTVRALGPRLKDEHITINGVAPNLIQSSLTPGDFYKLARSRDLLTPVETALQGFEMFLGDSELTGEICEASFDKVSLFEPTGFRDAKSKESFDVLYVAHGPAETSRVPALKREAEERLAKKNEKKL